MTNENDRAAKIRRFIPTEGCQEFFAYLNERIAILKSKIVNQDCDVEVSSTAKLDGGILLITVQKDSVRNEIKTLEFILNKFEEWQTFPKENQNG